MDTLQLHACTVDLRALRILRHDGSSLPLSAKEARLLGYLAERSGTSVGRDVLYAEVWGHTRAVVTRALDAMVLRLRQKVERDPHHPDHLLTVHGEGYKFEPAQAGAMAPAQEPREARILVAVDCEPGRATLVRKAAWRAEVEELRASAGGVLLEQEGDEQIVSFRSPARAVGFCLAAVEAGLSLGARGAGSAGELRRVRQLVAAARAGGVVLCASLHDEVSAAVGVRDRAWRKVQARLGAHAPLEELVETRLSPGPGLRPARGNLSLGAHPLLGRASELEAVQNKLASSRLVTLAGTGGVGKTRLAMEIGHRWQESAGGAWFCDLSSCHSEHEVLTAVARTLEVPLVAGHDLGHALSWLADDLLVLDNAEQALGPVRALVQGWREGEGARLLVTSREPLGLVGEEVLELRPLALEDGVALFLQRAGALGVEIRELEPVRALVTRLEGLPLALELAAARAEILQPAELLRRLEQGLPALGHDPARPRHTDLATLVRWSWTLLSPLEQRVLVAACVFASPFEVSALEAVASERRGELALEAAAALRRKSLLQAVTSRSGVRRLAPYVAVRAFVLERADPELLRAATSRHALHFALSTPPAGLLQLAEELPDLRVALEHGVEHAQLEVAVGAFFSAHEVLAALGPVGEIEALAQRVLPLCEGELAAEIHRARLSGVSDPDDLREIERHLEPWEGEGWLAVRANVAMELGDWPRAMALSERAVPLLRASGDAAALGSALSTQVKISTGRGRWEQALPLLREAIALYQAAGDRTQECMARMWLALAARHLGELDQILQEAQAARALAMDSPRLIMHHTAAMTLSALHRSRGEPALALKFGQESLALARQMGARGHLQTTLVYLGCLSVDYFGAQQAQRWLEMCRAHGAELDVVSNAPMMWGWLGAAQLSEDRLEEAVANLTRAVEGFEAWDGEEFMAIFGAHRGLAWLQLRQYERAQADLDRGVEVGQRLGLPHVEGCSRAWRAVLRAWSGAPGAREDLQIAEAHSGAIRSGVGHVLVELCRAEVAWLSGDLDLAQARLRRAELEMQSREMGPTTLYGAQARWLRARMDVAERHRK